MGPFGVALFETKPCGVTLPKLSRLAQALGVESETKQGFKGLLGGAAHGPLPPGHLAKLFQMRNMRHAGVPDHAVHPTIGLSQKNLQTAQGLFLLGGVLDADIAQVDGASDGLGIDLGGLAELLFHGVQIDGDSACVLAYQGLEAWHQPGDGCEEAGMGGLLEGQIAHNLIQIQVKG